jgi:hypothetical protein
MRSPVRELRHLNLAGGWSRAVRERFAALVDRTALERLLGVPLRGAGEAAFPCLNS